LSTAPNVAEAHLTTILDDRPDLYSAYLLRGIAHAKLGETAAAENDFANALARAPKGEQSAGFRYATLAFRGNFRSLRDEFSLAEQDLLAAVQLKPADHVAWLYLSQTYERQPGRAAEAAEQLEKALAATDLTPPVEAGILLYRARGPTREAAAALADVRRSLHVHPYAEAWVHLAVEQLRQKPVATGDYRAVVDCCDQALAAPAYSPETYDVSRTHYLRAHALVEMNRHDEAAEALDRFLAAGGQASAEIHRLLGLIRVKHGDYPSAIHELGEALALDPGNPSTLAERGFVYLAIGALGLAQDDFERSLAKDAENASATPGGVVQAAGDAKGQRRTPSERLVAGRRRSHRLDGRADVGHAFGHLTPRPVRQRRGPEQTRYRQRSWNSWSRRGGQPDQQAAFWRGGGSGGCRLRLLNDHLRYRELAHQYAPAATAGTHED
jgi:tetratricopeptide (TPR) repeat protein